MILTIDIGNSNICFAVHEENETRPLFLERIHTDPGKTGADYALTLREILALHGVNPKAVRAAVFSSVVPAVTEAVSEAACAVTGVKPLPVHVGLDLGFETRAEKPESIGPDILCDVSGALSACDAPLITIDMGTATVFTIVTPTGSVGKNGQKTPVLDGIMILPGIRTSLNSLSKNTSALPEISLKAPLTAIGKNTVDSMKSGIIFGTAAMVDEMIDRISAETGFRFRVFATGGLAPFIIPYCTKEITLDPELLMKGLCRILRNNRNQ